MNASAEKMYMPDDDVTHCLTSGYKFSVEVLPDGDYPAWFEPILFQEHLLQFGMIKIRQKKYERLFLLVSIGHRGKPPFPSQIFKYKVEVMHEGVRRLIKKEECYLECDSKGGKSLAQKLINISRASPGDVIITSMLSISEIRTLNQLCKHTETFELDPCDDPDLNCSLKRHCGDGEGDVVIKVKNESMEAHRATLKSSPVLAAMFSHDLQESNSGVITIDDCEPDAFKICLIYLYSSRVMHVTVSNVVDTYYVADKYDLPVVKRVCATFIMRNLTVRSVCDIFRLAARHCDEDLFKKTVEYFKTHAIEIFATRQWKQFSRENPDKAREICRNAGE